MASIRESMGLPEQQLVDELDALAATERRCSAAMLAHLAAMDERTLYRGRGYHSLYEYCIRKLRFGEAVSYWRMHAARAAKRCEEIVPLLEAGELTLATINVIATLIIEGKAGSELVQAARGKTKREVEGLVAALQPRDARRDAIGRPLGQATVEWSARPAARTEAASTVRAEERSSSAPAVGDRPAGQTSAMFPADKLEPVDGQKVRLHFDIGPETARLLTRAREVMRHKYPFASFEDIVREALELLLSKRDPELALKLEKEPRKRALTGGRRVPVWVRRLVWKRDRGRCAFIADEGVRCEARSALEYDHIVPYSKGGRSDDPKNIRLLCRAHNQHETDRIFGVGGPAAAGPTSASASGEG